MDGRFELLGSDYIPEWLSGKIVPRKSGHVPQFAIVTLVGASFLNPVPGAANLRQRGRDKCLFK